MTSTITRLTDQEWAVEVDTALADLWEVEQALRTPLRWAVDAVYREAGILPLGEKPSRWEKARPTGSLPQALQCLEATAAQAPPERPWEARKAAEALAKYAAARKAVDEVLAAQEPFNEEYKIGRWNRAWLVLNSNGHVHSSRACGTCFITTSFGWLPQVSGMSEAQIVDLAGESACTVCYPSAPVATLSQPRRMFHQTEVEAQQAREARATAKAEREAKKAAKAIANPDGSPLQVFDGRYTNHRTGQPYDRFETLETAHAAKAWLTDAHSTYYSANKRPEDIQQVAEALAAKFGTTAEAEIAAAQKRYEKRR